MKLIAMVMVGPGEEDRYLVPFLGHLLEFCDEVRVRWETERSNWEYSVADPRVVVMNAAPTFFQHEGRARQELLEWTMQGAPTHILAIDCDEFIADGQALRAGLETIPSHTAVWRLEMTEVWGADEEGLDVRIDGAWSPRPCGILFRPPGERDRHTPQTRRHYRMPDKALASGRTPINITMASNRTQMTPLTPILHFGWACEADRYERHQRYVRHDGGQFHKNTHLDSIMWGDDRVQTKRMKWPLGLDKETLLARVNRR